VRDGDRAAAGEHADVPDERGAAGARLLRHRFTGRR